ncbi:MAG TPA: porin [Acetobacteraceae bacterium]|nr:porin [Acetobacteraceae bacterium]
MRKLLLATVAGLGAWGAVANEASAQMGQPITPNYTGGASSPAAAAPTPGTVVVRLNGRVRFYAFGVWDKDSENNAAGTPTGLVNAAGLGTATGGNKLANYGFAEYARLYPGFDGIAANGLKYGASIEIRQDQSSGAGGGMFGSISTQNRARSALYFRRIWGYLGTNEIGTFRFGSIDQPSSLYMTGNFENFNDGGWNGDVPALIAGNNQVTWPFADVGSYYTTNKIVYLSPQFFGFDGGISFEPSTANVNANSNCGAGSPVGTNFINPSGNFTTAAGANGTGAASAGCDRLSSSPVNAESARRRNTFDVLVRYRGTFGPVGVAATGGYIGGGHVLDNSGLPFNNNPLISVTNAVGTTTGVRSNFEGLSVGDFGAQVTYAGFSIGGKYQFGRFNGQWQPLPKGLPDSQAWLVGGSYTIGPMIVGASYLNFQSAGDVANAFFGRLRTEQGFAAGGTYSLAPGVSIFLSYLWGQRKQNGFNFNTGQGVSATSPQGNPFSNKMTSNLISLGTAFSW